LHLFSPDLRDIPSESNKDEGKDAPRKPISTMPPYLVGTNEWPDDWSGFAEVKADFDGVDT
jgi:hypothetical protein